MEASWKDLGRVRFDDATKALLTRQIEASFGRTPLTTLADRRDEREAAVIKALADTPTFGSRPPPP